MIKIISLDLNLSSYFLKIILLMYYVNQMSLLVFKLVFCISRYLTAYQNRKIINLNYLFGLQNIFTLSLVFISFIGYNKNMIKSAHHSKPLNSSTPLSKEQNRKASACLLSNSNLFLSKYTKHPQTQGPLNMLSFLLFEVFPESKAHQLSIKIYHPFLLIFHCSQVAREKVPSNFSEPKRWALFLDPAHRAFNKHSSSFCPVS